jgi:hypothetical protein
LVLIYYLTAIPVVDVSVPITDEFYRCDRKMSRR